MSLRYDLKDTAGVLENQVLGTFDSLDDLGVLTIFGTRGTLSCIHVYSGDAL